MSLINRIKEFFKSKENKSIEASITCQITDIDSFLNKKTKEIESLLEQKTNIFSNEIDIILNNLEENIKSLDAVDLSKRKVEEKLKQITDSGRKDYIVATQKLIEKIKDEKKEQIRAFYIINELNNFIKSSGKSHFKATQLIGKEMENTTNSIIKIKSLSANFMKENSNLIESHNKIKALQIKNQNKKQNGEKKRSIEKEIKEIELNNIEKERDILNISKKIQEIKESNEYREKESLLNEKKEKEISLKIIESEIKSLIDRKILERYIYIEQDKENKKFAQEYIENPLASFLSDSKLKILNILEDTKNKIKNKEILIKEPSKAIEKASIEKDILLTLKKDIVAKNKEIKNLNEQINNIYININEFIKEKERIESFILQNKTQIETLAKKQDKIDKIISNLNSELSQSYQ